MRANLKDRPRRVKGLSGSSLRRLQRINAGLPGTKRKHRRTPPQGWGAL